MVETEIKLRVESLPAMRALLKRVGFRVHHKRIFEANTVFDTPGATLRSGGRLLRLPRVRRQGHSDGQGAGENRPA